MIRKVTVDLPEIKKIDLKLDVMPIGKKGEIKPYSPVNVIGKIVDTNKNFLYDVKDEKSPSKGLANLKRKLLALFAVAGTKD